MASFQLLLKKNWYRHWWRGRAIASGWNKEHLGIQILAIEELLHNAEVKMPPQFGTFKQAQRVQQSEGQQPELDFSVG